MDENYEKEISVLKVSYYSSYKQWALLSNFGYWPFFICFILTVLFGLLTGLSDITVFLLFFSITVVLFCAFVTRFYANAFLKVSKAGLIITKKDSTINFNWTDISDLAFLTPLHGLSHIEIVLAIYINNNIEYVFIESLYFKTAISRAAKLQSLIKKYNEGYDPIIQKSDFEPILLKKNMGRPNLF